MTIVINEFDGFRVEVDNENNRGDIILSRPPLNVIQYSQRIQMAEAMKDLDKNEEKDLDKNEEKDLDKIEEKDLDKIKEKGSKLRR